jgi:hypothetical protein
VSDQLAIDTTSSVFASRAESKAAARAGAAEGGDEQERAQVTSAAPLDAL